MRGNTEEVIKELREAIQLGDNNPAVIRQLVEALRERGHREEAWTEIRKLKQSLLVHSELGRLAASTALQKGDPARALQLARDAVSADSRDFREQLWLARMYEATSNPAEAERRILELRESIRREITDLERRRVLVGGLASVLPPIAHRLDTQG